MKDINNGLLFGYISLFISNVIVRPSSLVGVEIDLCSCRSSFPCMYPTLFLDEKLALRSKMSGFPAFQLLRGGASNWVKH